MDIVKKIEKDVSNIAHNAFIKDVEAAIRVLNGNNFLANLLQFRYNKQNDNTAGLSWLLEYRRNEIYDADKELLNFAPLRCVYEAAAAERYVDRMTGMVTEEFDVVSETVTDIKDSLDKYPAAAEAIAVLEGQWLSARQEFTILKNINAELSNNLETLKDQIHTLMGGSRYVMGHDPYKDDPGLDKQL